MPSDLREFEVWARTVAFARKLDQARAEIDRAAAMGSCAVATSWGKDSIALCDLVLDRLESVPLVHRASAYEMPGADAAVAHFSALAPIEVVGPSKSLSEVVEWLRSHGLGTDRPGRQSTKSAKRDAVVEQMRALGVEVEFLGMRAEEARGRRQCFRARGLTYRAHGMVVSNPIGWWSARDVWAYIASRGLPYPSLYDAETHGLTRETIRNAGWLTVPGGQTQARVAWLRAHYPQQWRQLVAEFPRLKMMS